MSGYFINGGKRVLTIYVHTLFSPCISFRVLGFPSLPITLGPCLFCKWPSYPFFDLKNTSQCEHRNSAAL